MKTLLVVVVSIDTEADHTPTWAKSSPLTFRSVVYGIPNLLQPLFVRYNVKPTYLLASEVLENNECVQVLKSLHGDYELGTHLHPEYVEPLRKYSEPRGTTSRDFLCSYSREVQRDKISSITELFKERIGIAPCSFRAGRYGADAVTLDVLEQLGYRVDSSVTPHLSWTEGTTVLDHTQAPEQPYFPNGHDIGMVGESRILEVPVSIRRNRFGEWFAGVRLGGSRLSTIKGLSRLCREIWLRPSLASSQEMFALMKRYQRRYGKRRFLVFNMMFHSMEVIPGASPYVTTKQEQMTFLRRLEWFLSCCKWWNVRFETLSSLYSLLATPPGGRIGDDL